ncbi:hypothetical protein V5O48_005674 [Marasmius crinis-equi]|uniref:C2H2-type domain-containing protein n=1 Tax=Marasmius crinis-equi TaxID=585013 RepID=A0ABR3FLT1_9AGAR
MIKGDSIELHQEYSMHPAQNDYQYHPSRIQVPPPDPHASAMQTDQALSALHQSHSRQYHQYPTHDPYAYHEVASSSRDRYMAESPMSYAASSNIPMRDPRDYATGPPLEHSRSYHSYDEPSLRQYSSSPTMFRHSTMYGQGGSDSSAANAKHQCKYCGKRFSRPSGLRRTSALKRDVNGPSAYEATCAGM